MCNYVTSIFELLTRDAAASWVNAFAQKILCCILPIQALGSTFVCGVKASGSVPLSGSQHLGKSNLNASLTFSRKSWKLLSGVAFPQSLIINSSLLMTIKDEIIRLWHSRLAIARTIKNITGKVSVFVVNFVHGVLRLAQKTRKSETVIPSRGG